MLEWFSKQGFSRFSLYEFQSTGRGTKYDTDYALNENELTHILEDLCAMPANRDIELLKLSLSARRLQLVSSMSTEFQRSGYEINDLSGAASLVVNYDASLGVCPWKVGPEIIGYYDPKSFALDVQQMIENRQLDHLCDHCSAIRVRTNSVAVT